MPAILWTVDRNLMITSSVGGGLKGIDVRPYELVGKSLLEYLGTTDPEHPEMVKHRKVIEGESFTFESEVLGCVLSCHMEPLRDHDGNITGCIGIALDVTNARRLQLDLILRNRMLEITSSNRPLKEKFTAVLQLLEGLYRGMRTSVMYLSSDGKVLSLAAGPSLPPELCEAVEKFPVGPQSGACGAAVFHRRQVIVENISQSPLFEGHHAFCESLKLRACWSQPILSSKGRVLGTLAMYFEHIKLPGRDEMEMLQWVAHLLGTAIEREQNDRFINGLLRDLERSNREMSRFISVASHDLREPLRTLSSYMRQIEAKLEAKLEGHLDEQTKMDMNFVTVSAKRMQSMISTLTEYSKVGSKVTIRKAVPMREIVETAIQDLKILIEESGASVTFDGDCTAAGHPCLVSRVVENLLANALRYRSQAPPKIHMTCTEKGGECLFQINDNGAGIDMKHAADIFQLFHRLDQTAYEDGLGLGLAVCKRIVEAHGGRIWVVSAPGKGSDFFFTLPPYTDETD